MTDAIDFTTLTPCGECCTGCKKREGGLCEGCLDTDGHCKEWVDSGRCPMFACTREHGVSFCGLCECFPREDVAKKIPWNSGIVEHLRRLAELYRKQNK